LLQGAYNGWKNKLDGFSYALKGDDIEKYFNAINSYAEYPVKYDITNMPSRIFHRDFYFAEGTLFVFSLEELSAETSKVLKRFAGVLGQTYRRFLDLQKAEAQAREAKIEAALERVRSKAMAMRKSDDLNDAVAIVFEELDKLNIGILRCGIGILDKETRCADVWTTTVSEHGHTVRVSGNESMDIHPLLHEAFEAWIRKEEDFNYMLDGENLTQYYRALTTTNFKLPESQQIFKEVDGLKQYSYHAMFESGALFAFRETEFPAEAKAVLKRFAGVFNLTYKRFLDIQKAEALAIEAQLQKQLIEVKHREITENINYALRIQTAILPAEKLIKECLQNSFVLYLPKDVVAGDFYWMIRVKDIILFAVCDCTGHGVSGAMVSVICNNALNGAVRECNLTQPSLILDKVAELVDESFTQSEDKIQDGMDASLCAYYPLQRKLQWAGANNPLWIVRNNELLEFKPDKQPIGKYENRQPYTNHEIELKQGDTIYIFSDGYQDQFGGEKGKKLTKKGLKNMLLSIAGKNMEAQYEALLNYHHEWKGKEEQVDDICVIGVRV
jgi:serine phosphatase RsbU (regulator of sigma subunit)